MNRFIALICLLVAFVPTAHAQDAGAHPLQERWTPNKWDGAGVQRDADWYAAQQIAHDQGFSYGDDGNLRGTQPDGSYIVFSRNQLIALIKALRFVWNNAGTLVLVFGLLAVASIFRSRMESGETHNEQMRREAEELESPGLSEDIHEPFNAPEGMQPASQYVSIRTRQ
jgi:hypothetical protein